MVKNIEATIRQWARDHFYDDDAVRIYGRSPRIVIVGESHNVHELKDQQIDLCARVSSDILLHEMLANYVYHPHERLLRRNPTYPVHPASAEYLAETLEWNQKERERESYEEIQKGRETYPLIGYKEFQQWRRDNNVGVLLNQFEETEIYGFFNSHRIHVGYTLSRLPKKIKKVVGCDIDAAELRFLIAKYQQQGILSRDRFDQSDLRCISNYYETRERRMAQVIKDSLPLTNMPLFVIVGADHIRNRRSSTITYEEWPHNLDSWMHKVLAEEGISYIAVDQTKSKAHREYVERWYKNK